jgi:hypothetical protein
MSKQIAAISLYSINWLVFTTETECVCCEVGNGFLNSRWFLPLKGWCFTIWTKYQHKLILIQQKETNWNKFQYIQNFSGSLNETKAQLDQVSLSVTSKWGIYCCQILQNIHMFYIELLNGDKGKESLLWQHFVSGRDTRAININWQPYLSATGVRTQAVKQKESAKMSASVGTCADTICFTVM